MTVSLSYFGGAGWQFLDDSGNPLSGGKIYAYSAGTTTPVTTYTSSSGGTPNAYPIILDSAGRPPAEIWMISGNSYKFTIKTSTDVEIRTYDNIQNINDLSQISSSSGSSLVGFIQSGSGAVARTVQAKCRDFVSVTDFGAIGDGIIDDSEAIRNCVSYVASIGGGGVYFPSGTYKVTKADVSNTAIYVPSFVRIIGASQVGVKIIPGDDNVVIFRPIGLNGGIENLQIDCRGKTNCSGVRLCPTDETQIITRTDVEFNRFENLSIRGCQEAITLKCGPTVGGTDSYCYYNSFINIDIRNCVLGIWFKEPNGWTILGVGSSPNRNSFINVRIGESGCNTGLQIDTGDTNNFMSCSFEGIQSGTSPNATPTAIKIAYNTIANGATHNRFFGLTMESCTRGIDNDNDILELYGWFNPGSPYYSGTSQVPAVDIRGDALSVNSNITGNNIILKNTDAPYLLFTPSDSATRKSVISSTTGFSSSYNGTGIKNNIKIDGTQANTGLPSWYLDLGGTEPGNGIGTADSFGLHRMAAGGVAWTTLFLIDSSGIIKPTGGYKSTDGSTGVSGSFVAGGTTVTVKNGIITSIV